MKKTSIGGSALIEGLMMIGPENAAIAIRRADGEIVIDKRPLPAKTILTKIPVIRGIFNFIRQMVVTMKALLYSADFVEIEDEEPSKFEAFLEKVFGDKLKDILLYLTVAFSIIFSVVLFMLLPNVAAGFLPFNKDTTSGLVLYNLFEGLIRIAIFIGYISLASMMKDIKRVWQYHGAEHKTINCYEHEEELTVDNVRKHSTKHPRCGTSFMFLVIIISILVFSVLPWGTLLFRIVSRLLMVPLVAGLSYELLKFAGRHSEWPVIKIINWPGLMFQRLTTKEPDDSQIEVGIAAFKNALAEDPDADKW